MTKIYTKTGDSGETSLLGGERVTKDCITLQVAGEIDELNSKIGEAVAHLFDSAPTELLVKIQHDLFKVGAEVASLQTKVGDGVVKVGEEEIKELEERRFGKLAGLTWDEAVKLTGDERLKIKDRNAEFDYSRFGGESSKQFKDRVWLAISKIRSTPIQGFPLIVTHGGVIRLLRSKFSHISLHEDDSVIKNGGLFEISFPMFV